MLQVGLTGGIGSGKSTVSARLAELGAVVVDADRMAREVVEPGTPASPRWPSASARRARGETGRWTGPRSVRWCSATRRPGPTSSRSPTPRSGPGPRELVARRPGAVVVHDVPLLVEKHLGAGLPPRRRRPRRRGDPGVPAGVRARADRGRRAGADRGTGRRRRSAGPRPTCGWTTRRPPRQLRAQVDALWHERLVPFNDNVRHGVAPRGRRCRTLWRRTRRGRRRPRGCWRLGTPSGGGRSRVDHIGSTAVPGLVAKDVIDLQVGVRDLGGRRRPGLRRPAGPGVPGFERQPGHGARQGSGPGRPGTSGSTAAPTPGGSRTCTCGEVGHPGGEVALLFRDWLRAHPRGGRRLRRPQARAGRDAVHHHRLHRGQGALAGPGPRPGAGLGGGDAVDGLTGEAGSRGPVGTGRRRSGRTEPAAPPVPHRRPLSVYGHGEEPDPRFSLANERTALAWMRTPWPSSAVASRSSPSAAWRRCRSGRPSSARRSASVGRCWPGAP